MWLLTEMRMRISRKITANCDSTKAIQSTKRRLRTWCDMPHYGSNCVYAHICVYACDVHVCCMLKEACTCFHIFHNFIFNYKLTWREEILDHIISVWPTKCVILVWGCLLLKRHNTMIQYIIYNQYMSFVINFAKLCSFAYTYGIHREW